VEARAHDAQQDLLGPLGAASDAEMALAEQRHRILAENTRDVVWAMGLDGSITYVSPAIEYVRGLTPQEAMSQPLAQIHPPASAARSAAYFTAFAVAVAAGRVPEPFHGELEYYRADGSTVWCEVQCFPVVGPDGRVAELLGVSRDISERRRYEEQLRAAKEDLEMANAGLERANRELARLALQDSLTGVCNRRHFDELALQAIARARRYQHDLAMLMIDVDHFKAINDSGGHLAGDQVLVALCARLQGRLRVTDTLARWGGEEFVVLVPEAGTAAAVELADALRTLVAAEPLAGFPVTVSIGVAGLRAGESLDALLARADDAMYVAKELRNSVSLGNADLAGVGEGA
jgi:diguanylate cyclase (GGDEF)-like protein/PAS domain S-box-containing protein